MSRPAARLGDPYSHGGALITASANVKINGKGAGRLTDIVSCPPPVLGHNPQPMVEGHPQVKVNGLLLVRCQKDKAACGGVIVSGSPDVTSTR